MTFVGRILVILIMIFSLIFLGLSTVAFSTAKNWKTATQDERKKVDELKKKLSDAQAAKGCRRQGAGGCQERFRCTRQEPEQPDQHARGSKQA